ncbi:MAG: N-acetyltransferase family protein [Sphaerochaetaceae bacterium]
METTTVRFVKEADAAEILGIYTPYILDTAITFECEIPSLEEFRKRIRDISTDYPYIVCLMNGKIIGYAYAHRHMERRAYQWNAELSVYIDRSYLHRGVGKMLYHLLLEILQLQNVQNVYGGITYPNENSEHLHEGLGFRKLGVYHNTGFKCGAWHDVMWFEKALGPYELEPKPFVSIKEIDKNLLEKIMNRSCVTAIPL